MKEETKKTPSRFALRIPKFTFKETPMNSFLVLSLIIFSFLLGMLTNKVIYLEQALKNPAPAAAPAGPTAAGPAAPAIVENMTAGKLPFLGSNDAEVTLVEFSDFQCPFCKKYFDETHKQINDTYIKTNKVKLAYRHFPLTSIHPNAQKAAEASECANEQGKFWEYHDLLFKEQDTWSPLAATDVINSFVDLAGQLSINTSQFQTCLESDKYKQNVNDDTAAATSAQVDATPSFFVNGVRVVGAVPFAELQKTIEEQLKK